MIVKINGVEVPHADRSIDIDDAIGQRSTASFSIVDKIGNMRFKKGENVLILQEMPTGEQLAKWENDDLTNNWEVF